MHGDSLGLSPAVVQAFLRALGVTHAEVNKVLTAMGVDDAFLTLDRRYDNAFKPFPGGFNVPGGSPAQALGATANPPAGHELVSWNREHEKPQGNALRIWVNPEVNYNLQTDVQVGNANSMAAEILVVVTGFGGAWTSRRFVVNGGQDAVLEIAPYERGVVSVVAAANAFNVVAPATNAQNQGFVNFTWIESQDQLANAAETKLMSRTFEAAYGPAPQVPTRVVVPPGGVGFLPYGQVHVGQVDFAWPTAIAPTTVARAGGLVPLAAFPPPPIGQVLPIRGAKFLDLEAPVGWPHVTIQFQFQLAGL